MQSRDLKSIALLFGSQGVSLLSSLICTVLLGKALSIDDISTYAILISIQSGGLILLNPWQAAGLHFLNSSQTKTKQTEGSLLFGRLFTWLFLALVLSFGKESIEYFLNIPTIPIPLLAFILLQLLFFSIEKHILQVQQSKEQFLHFSFLNSMARALKLIAFISFFINQNLNIYTVLLSIFSTQLLAILPFIKGVKFKPSLIDFKKYINYLRWNFLSELFVYLGQKYLIFFLIFLGGQEHIAYWGWSEILLGLFLSSAQAINTWLAPKFFSTSVHLTQIWKPVLKLSFLYGVLCLLFGTSTPYLLDSFFGNKYEGALPFFYAFLPGTWLFLSCTTLIIWLHREGKMKTIFQYELIQALAVFPIGYFLFLHFSYVGLAIGVSIARLFQLLFLIRLFRKL